MATQRIEAFDILKGIGIILMIVAHTYGPKNILWDYIYAFHMPLFFIVSGYFFREKPFKELFAKNFNQLLKPYLVLSVIIVILLQVRQPHHVLDDIRAVLNGIGPGWFFLAMFFARIGFNLILKLVPNYYLLISVLISTITCLVSYQYKTLYLLIPFSLLPSLSSLVFISVGYYIKQHNLFVYFDKHASVTLVLSMFFWILTSVYGEVEMSRCIFKWSVIDFIGSIGGFFVFYKFSQLLEKYSHYIKNVFLYAGRFSIVILFFHSIDYCVPMWHHLFPYVPSDYILIAVLVIRFFYLVLFLYITLQIRWLRKFFGVEKMNS